jgi:hypothetical protein
MDTRNFRDSGRKSIEKDSPRRSIGKPKAEIFLNGEAIDYSSKGWVVNFKKKEGIEISQLEASSKLDIKIKGNVYKVINEKDYTEIHGPNIHLKVNDDGIRYNVTFLYEDSKGFPQEEIRKMGADSPKATLGNLTLTHQNNGALEIEINAEDLREKEIVKIEGHGNNRNMKYEYYQYNDKNNENKLIYSIYFNGIKSGTKEIDKQKREDLKKQYEKKYPSAARHGGLEVVNMVRVLVY